MPAVLSLANWVFFVDAAVALFTPDTMLEISRNFQMEKHETTPNLSRPRQNIHFLFASRSTISKRANNILQEEAEIAEST
jgi:hypothetical protein